MTDIARWDAWNRSSSPRYPHEKVVQFMFRAFPDRSMREAVRALDLGCGGGVHTAFLAREGFDVTAIDISPAAIEATRSRLEGEGLAAELEVASIDAARPDDRTFGLVVCSGVLDAAGPAVGNRAVSRVPSVMEPGSVGIFVFASDRDFRVTGDNGLELHGYTRAEVETCFGAGFTEVWIDSYVTTYRGGEIIWDDWLVTVRR